jgi:hypothetical protein
VSIERAAKDVAGLGIDVILSFRADAEAWRMGDGDERSGAQFSYVDLEARVGWDHPL